MNVSQSYISNGNAIPEIAILEKMLIVLDSKLSKFFSEEFQEYPTDLLQLLDTAKTLSTKAKIKLNEFIKLIQKSNNL